MTVDLCMWTWNGEKTLGAVLQRINNVVPSGKVNQRLIIDDHSSDKTRSIAETYGWNVVNNRGTGISDGANTALDLVETPTFCSFEQDLLLSEDWWQKVVPLLDRKDVAAASGIRHQYPSLTMRKLHEYTAERYVKWRSGLPIYLNTEMRVKAAMSWGRTLDNTIYKTDILREMGGFPDLQTPGGIDTVLTFLYINAGYEWFVDFNVVSQHLNKTFRGELRCQFNYGSCYDAIAAFVPGLPVNLRAQAIRFLYSPIAAVHPAVSKRCPSIVFAYPLIRFNTLRGLFHSRRKQVCKKT